MRSFISVLQIALLCVCCVWSTAESQEVSLKPSHEWAYSIFRMVVKRNQGKNVIMSVPAMLNSMTMLYEGAAGKTEKLLQQVVQFPEDKLAYRKELKLNGETLKNNLGSQNIYTSGARLYANTNLEIKDTYKQIMTDNYPTAAIEQLDFNKPAAAIQKINDWVNDTTKGLIPTIVNAESVDSDTELMIVNVEYFKGLWKYPFNPNVTQNRPFYLNSRETIQVPTMFVIGQFQVRYLDHVTLIKLPYLDSRISFTIALPKKGMSLDYVEYSLKHSAREFKHPEATEEKCELFLPKFTIEQTLDFTSIFREGKLAPLFTKGMNLTTMVGDQSLSVSSIVQKARVQVDELGSTAAAAQAVGISMRMMPPPITCILHVERPFFFLIQEGDKEQPLFLGKVTKFS